MGHPKHEVFGIVDSYMETSRKQLEDQVWAQERGRGRSWGSESQSAHEQDLAPWEKVSLPKEVRGTRKRILASFTFKGWTERSLSGMKKEPGR